jgi:hypothetical protein
METTLQESRRTVSCAARRFAVVLLLGIVLGSPLTGWAQQLRSPEEASRLVSLEKVVVENGSASGEIHNRTAHTLRDVELLIRNDWFWTNEFKPGADGAGSSVYYKVAGEVPPGGTARFKYTPATPLAKRPDGYYQTTVKIAGFTEVIPQAR